jgi:hypothetical protein
VRHTILRFLSSLIFICLFAFSCRVAFLIHDRSTVPSDVLASVPFQNEAGNIAQALTQGHGFCCVFRQPTGPTAWLTPVYPLILAAIFKLFGVFTVHSYYAAALLNCSLSALVSIPVFLAGKRIGGIFCASLAAWIWALFPSGIIMPSEWIWETSLSALFAALLLWATLYVADKFSYRFAAAYGALWGFSLLVNPALGSLFPFFLAWIVFRQIRLHNWNPRPAILALALAIVICLPWTIRNAVQFHRLIPLRSNFPFELWMGNNEIYDQHSREVNRITRYEQIRLYQKLGETAFLADKLQKTKLFIREHPALTFRLAGQRMIATWFGTATPFTDFQRTDSPLARFIIFWNAITVIGIFAGVTRLVIARNMFVFPLAMVPLVFPMVYYFTQTSLRLRHPCDPILALLLAIAIALPPRDPVSQAKNR